MFQLLDLFSGIGGFSLGLERSGGFQTVAFCEIEPFCRKVLKKHWPDVPCYEDVRTLTAERLRADGIVPDAICGGFPCQDISVAGKGAGIEGERSGLWSEYARIIGELRPRIVIVENVAALLGRGLSRVLADLAALGFDAEWHCIPASAVGAPHRRDRLWIVANSRHGGELNGSRSSRWPIEQRSAIWCLSGGDGATWPVAHANDQGQPQPSGGISQERGWVGNRGQSIDVADAICSGLEGRASFGGHLAEQLPAAQRGGADVPHPAREHVNGAGIAGPRWERELANSDWWLAEPDVGRVAHGVPARVDRLRALGNAVVPQIPELIGRAILEAEGCQ